jgi:hypothetical protein
MAAAANQPITIDLHKRDVWVMTGPAFLGRCRQPTEGLGRGAWIGLIMVNTIIRRDGRTP